MLATRPGWPPGVPPGPDPEGRSYASYASFAGPDGNRWLLQEITERLPGRVRPDVDQKLQTSTTGPIGDSGDGASGS